MRFLPISLSVATLLLGCGDSSTQSSIGSNVSPPVIDQSPITAEEIEEVLTLKPINISRAFNPQHSTDLIKTPDGKMHIFWSKDDTMYYSSSISSIDNFTEPKGIVEPGAYITNFNAIDTAYADGSLHVTWTYFDSIRFTEIFRIYSLDGGNSFTTPMLTSYNDNIRSIYSSIASDSKDRVIISWKDDYDSFDRFNFIVSDDGGMSFSEPQLLPSVLQESGGEHFQISSNSLYAFWNEIDHVAGEGLDMPVIYFYGAKSDNNGVNFIPTIQTDRKLSIKSPEILKRTQNGHFYAVDVNYIPNTSSTLFFSYSEDDGRTFSQSIGVSEVDKYISCPSMTFDGDGNIYISWSSYKEDNFSIINRSSHIAVSYDGGRSFSPPYNLPTIVDNSCIQIEEIEKGKVGLLWKAASSEDFTGPVDLYYSVLEIPLNTDDQ